MNEKKKASPLERNAEKALAMKRKNPPADHPSDRTAGEGMHPEPNAGIAPSGALGAEGERPALGRSRGR
jgi:hypothetical protein